MKQTNKTIDKDMEIKWMYRQIEEAYQDKGERGINNCNRLIMLTDILINKITSINRIRLIIWNQQEGLEKIGFKINKTKSIKHIEPGSNSLSPKVNLNNILNITKITTIPLIITSINLI